ncbi:hypothetical protein [Bradyrhizobium sp. SZCCHNS3053]|uniref:hypothetical protein n=1 Tax=Bradyrhizobium sp. SZCCHNS3053 TaxID=3057322 RepID=UPI0029160305|nr:hypothetical protein [Bradyrhizobium sp. SZCCHNS3053]
MTITISSWAIPILLTLMILAAVELWPIKDSGFGLSAMFDGIFHAACGIVGILVVWLVYFAVRFAIG